MSDGSKVQALEFPISRIAPEVLGKEAIGESTALFLSHRTKELTLLVPWQGESHLVYLEGDHAFQEGPVGVGNPVHGALVDDIQFLVDVTSRYDSNQKVDPLGALVLQAGELSLYCRKLGDRFNLDPHRVPLAKGNLAGNAEEACGFTRWSIVVREDDRTRVIRSFQARAD